jgi:Ankyrin repeat
MVMRRLAVRPDRAQLQAEADALLRGAHDGQPESLAELTAAYGRTVDGTHVTLAEAQHAVARSYTATDWTRLMLAVDLVDAIWRDEIDTVRTLVTAHPALLHEHAIIRTDSNWGPPMSYAANLGRDAIIRMLHERGARDIERAMDRAALQGQIPTVTMLHELAGRPSPPVGALGGPAYTLDVDGTKFMLGIGAPVVSASGTRLAPVDVVLETDSRKPTAKHAILELYAEHGLTLPDTPTMALHRGRLDLLEAHLRRDPLLLSRRFSHREIYPTEMGCADPINATTGTPLAGTTLLHMCVDYDEFEIAEWLIARGADVNARATIGNSGFGGFTPLSSARWCHSRTSG